MRESRVTKQEEKPCRGERLNVAQASQYIHMGKTSVYQCIKDGTLPFFRPARGKIFFDSADLDEYLRVIKVPAGTVSGNI